MLYDSQTLVQLIKDYKKQHPDLAKRISRPMSQAVCKIAAKNVLNKALQLRKENVGSLLKNIKLIKCLDIKENEGFILYSYTYVGLYGSGYFNFVAKVPSQSCSCAFSVLISLHFLSFFGKMFLLFLYI